MPMKRHRHHQMGPAKVRPWFYCVASGRCSGAPHGCVVYVETCACGATRRTEVNGTHRATSGWVVDETEGE
jgi:hypothetical protein